jgi:hypothetical protein
MKRTQIGIIALVLLLGALARYLSTGDLADMFLGGLLRMGLVMGALWLALPQFMAWFAKMPKWLPVAVIVSVVVFSLRPQLLWWLPVALAGVVGVWFAWSRLGGLFKRDSSSASSGPARTPRRPKRKS